MPRKKLRVVSLDEVRITRRGDTAEFEYADEAIGGMSLKLGTDVSHMSDEELLERHNEVVRSMEAAAASYEHVAIEVPVGRPQLRYFAAGDQWTPRGAVLRCVISDGGPDGEATIEIDDRELSLREFGRMLATYAGWGMRLVFVPDDEIHEEPVIEVREPEDDAKGSPGRDDRPLTVAKHVVPAARATTPDPAHVAPAAGAAASDPTTQRMPIYQLRITLEGTEPLVWRTVLISGNVTLKKLHLVVQASMGWTNSHLHLFASSDGKDAVSDPRFALEEVTRDESKVKLRSFAPKVGHRFRYEYDFGDCWRHDVLVEAILPPAGAGRTPRCIDGARACPPEDCGGAQGHATLVAAMQDRRHPERARFLDWLGAPFDPDALDLAGANERLRSLK